jgi:hypothetical protein
MNARHAKLISFATQPRTGLLFVLNDPGCCAGARGIERCFKLVRNLQQSALTKTDVTFLNGSAGSCLLDLILDMFADCGIQRAYPGHFIFRHNTASGHRAFNASAAFSSGIGDAALGRVVLHFDPVKRFAPASKRRFLKKSAFSRLDIALSGQFP